MKVVISIDSLKGSLSSVEAGNAVKKGIENAWGKGEYIVVPLADGGEGTVDAVVSALGGKLETVKVKGPLFEDITACYGRVGELAVIEMAAASGLPLVPPEKRNPLLTTTYGTGQLIRHAVENGCRRFILGIGGSATNDAGIGMLQALGYEFLDEKGNPVNAGGGFAGEIKTIKEENKMPQLEQCFFQIASDVNNPLCGQLGASAIYGPQKGATPQMIKQLDENLLAFSKIVKNLKQKDYANEKGAGAAGGLGFGCLAFLNCQMASGIDIVLKEIGHEKIMEGADFVVTGEGRLDQQTAMGKAPAGVGKMAKKMGIPVIAFAGGVTKEAGICNEKGIDAFFSIIPRPMSLEEAMNPQTANENMTAVSEQVFRLIKAVKCL